MINILFFFFQNSFVLTDTSTFFFYFITISLRFMGVTFFFLIPIFYRSLKCRNPAIFFKPSFFITCWVFVKNLDFWKVRIPSFIIVIRFKKLFCYFLLSFTNWMKYISIENPCYSSHWKTFGVQIILTNFH